MRHTTLALVAVLFAGPIGCYAESTDDTWETIGSQDDELYVLSTAIWPSPVIPVCWENPTAADAIQRAWVRQATLRTWEAVSAVRFVGWAACSSGSAGIRIRIADEGPHTKGLGDALDGRIDGMVLNFTFNNWSPSCQSSSQYCIETIAVHEFGHALGFAHEQNRPDTPSWCNDEQGTDGDTMVGGWDIDSVMNYCNPDWNGDGSLSNGDIAGVQQFYGPATSNCNATPLYSYWNPSLTDHMVSTLLFENFWGWEYESEVGLICQDNVPGTVAIHSYWNPGISDHFYAQDYAPGGFWGYQYEGVLGYVYQNHNSSLNTKPMCRYWHPTITDHYYYGPDVNSCPTWMWGWNFERVEGYLLR